MQMKDVKSLITGGVIIIAFILYVIFGDAPPNMQKNDTATPATDDAIQITLEETEQQTGKTRIPVKYIKSYDGDTIQVERDGKKEKIRLLMVDTPEMNYQKGEPQPYAEDGLKYTKQIMESAKDVEIVFDVGPETDKYDRLLAYVFVDGKMLQEALLEEGLAAVRYIHKPNNTLEDEFREVQKEAQDAKINIWSQPNYLQRDGFHPEVFQ